MKCKKCGQTIPDGSHFCRLCGADQTRPVASGAQGSTPAGQAADPTMRVRPPVEDGTMRVRPPQQQRPSQQQRPQQGRPQQRPPQQRPQQGRPQQRPQQRPANRARRKSGNSGLVAVLACCVLALLVLLVLLYFVVFSDSHDDSDDAKSNTTAHQTTRDDRADEEPETKPVSATVAPVAATPSPTHAPAPTATPARANQGSSERMVNSNCPFDVHAFGYMLRYRLGPGTDYEEGDYYVMGIVRIVEVRSGTGSGAGWGRMENGDGWISLDYCDYYEPGASARMDLAECPFTVEVRFSILNVRSGPGTNYSVISDECLPKGTYTITEFSTGSGSEVGWGKLSDGGWISLDYCRMI